MAHAFGGPATAFAIALCLLSGGYLNDSPSIANQIKDKNKSCMVPGRDVFVELIISNILYH